ncbi:MAG: response regulator [Oligoflexales bacterium]|nr:response regulator [Oligoflexales bacterium]
MSFFLSNPTAVFVLVVEPASSVRMMLMELLRGFGYNNIQGVATCKEALSLLEVEAVQWLIMPLSPSEPVNALQIIKLITTEPKLRGIVTSLLLDLGAEEYCLPLAFEMGLLSWLPKSYVKETLESDLSALLKTLSSHDGNTTLTSAEYLRKFLTEKKRFKSRVALEQNLLTLYPGSGKILVNLAEAEIFDGGEQRALSLLHQAEILDGKLATHCQRLKDKYLKNLSSEVDGAKVNSLGIKQVVVIDPDTDVLHATHDLLSQLGVASIETFEDGKKANEWLKTKEQEPDLIIMEWRIPGMGGPVLIQRIRQSGYVQVPIIVSSSLIKKEERPLLKEMGIDEVLEKPFDQSAFYSVVIGALQQNKLPTEQKSLEGKIRKLLHAGRQGEAEPFIAQFLADQRISAGSKMEIKAEWSFALEDYTSACKFGAEALKLGGDTLALLNLVGKSLLKLNEYSHALQCFEKANAMCSINIERLLNVTEINLQLDRSIEANKSLESASAIDGENSAVVETRCKLDLEKGDVKSAAKAMNGLESVPRVAAYINNRAIALARSERFEDGIVLYKRAIQCLSGKWKNLRASVIYNLSLAYARNGVYEEAVKVLAHLCQDNQLAIHKKALSLMRKVQMAIKEGKPLFSNQEEQTLEGHEKLSEKKGNKESRAIDLHAEDIEARIGTKRGDLGCYLIYHSVEEIDQKAHDLVLSAKMPSFSTRRVIEKENSSHVGAKNHKSS